MGNPSLKSERAAQAGFVSCSHFMKIFDSHHVMLAHRVEQQHGSTQYIVRDCEQLFPTWIEFLFTALARSMSQAFMALKKSHPPLSHFNGPKQLSVSLILSPRTHKWCST